MARLLPWVVSMVGAWPTSGAAGPSRSAYQSFNSGGVTRTRAAERSARSRLLGTSIDRRLHCGVDLDERPGAGGTLPLAGATLEGLLGEGLQGLLLPHVSDAERQRSGGEVADAEDRKSTRLNSSH